MRDGVDDTVLRHNIVGAGDNRNAVHPNSWKWNKKITEIILQFVSETFIENSTLHNREILILCDAPPKVGSAWSSQSNPSLRKNVPLTRWFNKTCFIISGVVTNLASESAGSDWKASFVGAKKVNGPSIWSPIIQWKIYSRLHISNWSILNFATKSLKRVG